MSQEETQILVNEQLTAYLDGELSGSELAAVEQRLIDDPQFLAQMQQLQQSWDLLDVLPPTQGYDAFVKTTMELVVQDSGGDQNASAFSNSKVLAKVLMLVLIPGAVFASSYAVTQQQNTASYRRLIGDLPLIENHDRYAKLNLELDFLIRLHEASLFTRDVVLSFASDQPADQPADRSLERQSNQPPDQSSVPASVPGKQGTAITWAETINDRKLRLKQMQPRQLESLKRNKEKFDQLPPSRREEIAAFDRQLMQQENKTQLFKTMIAYYDWLKSLGATERIEVLDEVDIDRRIEMIARIVDRNSLREFGKAGATMLPAADAEPFFKWYQGFLKQQKSKIVQSANGLYLKIFRAQSGGEDPPAHRFRRFQRSSLSQKIGFMFQWEERLMKNLVDEDDVHDLRNQLSLEANEILDSNDSQEDQMSLIVSWIDAANQAKFNIDPQRLKEFYDSLPKTQRDELDSLSPSDWKDQLREIYRKKRFNEK